ncbi:MAG TPA: STAS domain-containing protein [Solirubrobacteraceae bacterium]|nr:STAS domain-containing protein [Solirubrobacteraceae bacterium]
MPEQSQRSPVRFTFSHYDLDARTAVVSVEGDCDLASAPTLKWALLDLLAGGRSRLIVDLSPVTFMDSTALGALVGIEMNLKDEEMLVLAAAPPGILSLFELTGLDRRLTLYATVDEAVTDVCGESAHMAEGESARVEYEPDPVGTDAADIDGTGLTRDAALALGIAATAVPFARTRPAQAERWLRALHRCGGAGVVLGSRVATEIPEAQVSDREALDGDEPHAEVDRDAVATVTDLARRLAGRCGEGAPIRTTDLLEAVIEVYGWDLDSLLPGYGTTREQVLELLSFDLDDLAET